MKADQASRMENQPVDAEVSSRKLRILTPNARINPRMPREDHQLCQQAQRVTMSD